MHARIFAAALLSIVVVAGPARAEPWFGWHDGRLEDRYLDGDFDADDVVALRLGRGHVGASDLHGRSWLTLKGFYAERASGVRELGITLILGLAFDKIAAGRVHRTRDAFRGFADGAAAKPTPAPPPAPKLPVTPAVARACVAAAWKASGLGVDDARIDAIIARARQSAALPEARFRAMRLVDSSGSSTTSTATDSQRLYDAMGAKLWLEARLTWRLDRLVYADDEPTLERVRLERQDARARISARVLDALFAWQRAWLELAASIDGSREQMEAAVRMAEAEAALDVLTSGWFGSWRTSLSAGPPTPK